MMREHMQARLEMLRKELEKGRIELQKVENQRTYLRETMLQIRGAIQVLEELLVAEQPVQQNGATSTGNAQPTATYTNGSDV